MESAASGCDGNAEWETTEASEMALVMEGRTEPTPCATENCYSASKGVMLAERARHPRALPSFLGCMRAVAAEACFFSCK
jgi:hypothetical protein